MTSRRTFLAALAASAGVPALRNLGKAQSRQSIDLAAGWKGATNTRAPGFPDDGSWKVRSEGLNSQLLANL